MVGRRVAYWLVLLLYASAFTVACADPVKVEVYKTPGCECCGRWAAHLRESGFAVEEIAVPDVRDIKLESGLPPKLASCHTGFVDGYLIEGHVPASDIRRLLQERPAIAGLAAPGMPIGSPGMEGPNPEPYDVLAFDSSGKISVFASHTP